MTISFIRTIILYIIIIIALRIMGKRQVGELSPSELVVTILISELASIPMEDNGIPLISGIVPILTLLALEILTSMMTMKSNRARRIMIGQSSMIINNGIINQAEMRRLRLTINELLEELRLKDYPDIKQVRYAILETSGKLSVIPYSEYETPTRKDLDINGEENTILLSLILDGKIIHENLDKLNKTQKWLKESLKKNGYKDEKQIFLLQSDTANNITIIPKE